MIGMKKEQKSTISLEKYFLPVFHFIALSEDGILTRKEIEDKMVNQKICQSRQVTKILDAMISKEHLDRDKIRGYKPLGYVINEEIIKGGNESFVTIGLTKKGKPKVDRLTQTELNKEIKDMIKKYRKEIGNKKSDMNNNDELFYIASVTLITLSLSWISRLVLTVQGGIFGTNSNKITLAGTNILLLEDFLAKICFNLHERFQGEKYGTILSLLMNYFENLDPFVGTDFSREKITVSSLIR